MVASVLTLLDECVYLNFDGDVLNGKICNVLRAMELAMKQVGGILRPKTCMCCWTLVARHEKYGTIKQDTTHLGIYGQTRWNKLSADWSATYGLLSYNHAHSVNVGATYKF